MIILIIIKNSCSNDQDAGNAGEDVKVIWGWGLVSQGFSPGLLSHPSFGQFLGRLFLKEQSKSILTLQIVTLLLPLINEFFTEKATQIETAFLLFRGEF